VPAYPFDVAVVGAGPAGSVAALVLARGGARVALIDRAGFPRDKACGDLVGPRGVQVLHELGVDVPGAPRLGDMAVIGPTGSRVVLPAVPGRTYPGYAVAVPRSRFDALLRDAALDAGAVPVAGRVASCDVTDADRGAVAVLDDGSRLRADVIIGADGALSVVGDTTGLCDATRSLWGFAVRSYADECVDLPTIVFWDEAPGRGLPGYGWVFPGGDGGVNLGLGIGMGANRRLSVGVTRRLPAFLAHLRALGLIGAPPPAPSRSLGGWLRVGMAGTVPGRGRVLLVGDAAALVNPLQGEGIAHALTSGSAAATAILGDPPSAARRYREWLANDLGAFASTTATVHAAMIGHPRAVSVLGRVVTSRLVGPRVAGAWAIYWNALLPGATPSAASAGAAVAQGVARLATAPARTRRLVHRDLGDERVTRQPPPVGPSAPARSRA
jgi:geranylgeranyl reductase family protein